MSKRLVILGGGESGVGAAILAKQQGYEVFLSDSGRVQEKYKQELIARDIEYEEAQHTEEKILNADEIVKSPGIPEKSHLVKKIRALGIEVISEIEFGFRYKGNSQIIGITGSNGKTTTTALIYHICRHAGLDCALVGNIGFSFAWQVAKDPKPWYVAEISSFQLDDVKTFRPDVAIITNITQDHLDRYEYKFENYINSKFRITMNQTAGDVLIYCADDPVVMNYIQRHPLKSNLLPFTMQEEINEGAFIKNEEMTVQTGEESFSMSIYDFTLRGKHNQYNTMAAGLTGVTVGSRKEKIREAIQSFESLEHRMEYVATVRGVEFINDSKATNMNSTWFALESMSSPTILILGGVDKGNDYSIILDLVRTKVKAIVCLGTDNSLIHQAFVNEGKMIVDTTSAVQAVHEATQIAEKGDVVLLSPGCASFDLFKNYEDRGRQFKEVVKSL